MGTTFKNIKHIVKKIIVIAIYLVAIVSLGYGIWYAIKNRNNGNNPLLNVLIGVFDGLLRVVSYVTIKWIDSEKQSEV